MTAKEIYKILGQEKYDKKSLDVVFDVPDGPSILVTSVTLDAENNVVRLGATVEAQTVLETPEGEGEQ